MNDIRKLFTTYNSVDAPEEIVEDTYIPPTPQVINNPLYDLLDKVSEPKQTTKEETPKQESLFGGKEFIENKPEEKQEIVSSNNVRKTLFNNRRQFIDTMKPIYSKILKEKGLDEKYADYLVAQAALESGWGKSQSGKNNLGGIKVPSKQKGKGLGTVRRTREVINGKEIFINDEFMDFKDLEDYARYHVNLLNNMNYKAFNGDFISNVVRGGYATDPQYREILTKMYNQIIRESKTILPKHHAGTKFPNSTKPYEVNNPTSYKIQKGDSWNKIANKFGYTEEDLIKANAEYIRTKKGRFWPNDVILLPKTSTRLKYAKFTGNYRPSRNWDNTYTGRMINISENPDSVGYRRVNGEGRWYKSTRPGDDPNNRGMGVDINTAGIPSEYFKRDKKTGEIYLTEEDERLLRFFKIDQANEKANSIYYHTQKNNNSLKDKNVSKDNDALFINLLYNKGIGGGTSQITTYGTDKLFNASIWDFIKGQFKNNPERVKNITKVRQ